MHDLVPAEVKAYTIKELAELYHRSHQTIVSWLVHVKNLGTRIGQSYNPAQVQKIFNHVGYPMVKKITNQKS